METRLLEFYDLICMKGIADIISGIEYNSAMNWDQIREKVSTLHIRN